MYQQYPHESLYSSRSLACLRTCHNDLQRLFISLADDGWDIAIICGHRPKAAQNDAHERGFSSFRWPDSKHNLTPSMAVDPAPYIARNSRGVPWFSDIATAPVSDVIPWFILAGAVFHKAAVLGIKVRWGGVWGDYDHWELVL